MGLIIKIIWKLHNIIQQNTRYKTFFNVLEEEKFKLSIPLSSYAVKNLDRYSAYADFTLGSLISPCGVALPVCTYKRKKNNNEYETLN